MLRRIPPDLRFPLAVFAGSRLLTGLWLLAFTMVVLKPDLSLGPGFSTPLPGIPTQGFFNQTLLMPWYRWDTVFYIQVALQGYTTYLNNTAWPPLYSGLIFLVNSVLNSPLLSGLAISNLAALAAMVVVYRLVSADFGPGLARRTLIWLAVFPTSFFLTAAYSEPLFLALSAGMLLAARRHRFWLAATLAALAALTRVLGILLILPLSWEMFQASRQVDQTHISNPAAPSDRFTLYVSRLTALVSRFTLTILRNPLPLLLIPLPYLLFSAWVHFGLGTAWPWQTISSSWELVYAPPWTGIIGNMHTLALIAQGYALPAGTTVVDLAAVGFGTWLLIAGARRIPVSYTLFAAALLLASLVKVTSGGLLVSTSRYLAPLFPLFITQALVIRNHWVKSGLFILLAVLQLLLVSVFWLGFWVG